MPVNMPLKPLFSYAEKHGWLSPSSYLRPVAAGLGLWSGGTGRAGQRFSVTP